MSMSAIAGDDPPVGLNDIYWTKGSPIVISGQDFVVDSGQTLYIEAGVVVLIKDNLGIDVHGKIIANGTSDELIHFTLDPGSAYGNTWKSLAFTDDEGSVLNHVVIGAARTGVQVTSSSPRFVNSEIGAFRSAAVVDSRSGPASNPVFENCTLFSGMAYFDFDVSGNSWVTALNTTFNSTNTKIGDPTAHIERQWFLDVHVDNSIGENVHLANVLLEDNENGTAMNSGSTGSDGALRLIATEYVDSFGFFGDNRTYYTPHEITASKLGYEDDGLSQMWIDSNRDANLTLVDLKKPVTTLVVTGPTFSTAPTYVGSTTQFLFDVSPGGTKPVQTMYSINGGAWNVCDQPFGLNDEGLNSITFYSVDPAGNVEPLRSNEFHLDTTAPTVTAKLNPAGEGTNPVIVEGDANLELQTSDLGSGLESTRYSTNGGSFRDYAGRVEFSNIAYYNLSYVVKDNIGNTASGKLWFRIVAPAPVVVNNPPYFIMEPVEVGTVGKPYVYFAEAFDPDEDDDLTYELINSPTGMAIDASTGLVTWTPEKWQRGQNLIFIYVTDGQDGDAQIFYIRVKEREPVRQDNLMLILGAMGVVGIALGSAVGLTEYGRFRFLLFFVVPLYSKLNKEKVLNQFLRGQIYGYIMAYPGENYSSIKKAMGVENGTLTHHLYILEREGFVTSRVDGRNKRFYPAGTRKKVKPKASMIQKAILKMIRQSPDISQTEIAESLGTSKQVVNYHIKSLLSAGLLSIEKNGSNMEYHDLSQRK